MSIIANILWIIIGGGVFLAIEYIASGIAMCATIYGIPLGFQFFKLALLSLLPFGRKIEPAGFPPGIIALILNIIWILTGGLVICLTHLAFGIICAITIIGIPFALQHMKLARLALTPFGSKID